MDNENKRKTLANCKNSEFLSAAMKARKIVYEYYQHINVTEIMERLKQQYEADTNNPASVLHMITDVISAIFTEYPEETVKLAAIAGFMTEEEAETISPTELFSILLECALSERVLDFFISVENTGGRSTVGIYRALIFLRVISGELNTSDSESETGTNEKNESLPVGAMPESA